MQRRPAAWIPAEDVLVHEGEVELRGRAKRKAGARGVDRGRDDFGPRQPAIASLSLTHARYGPMDSDRSRTDGDVELAAVLRDDVPGVPRRHAVPPGYVHPAVNGVGRPDTRLHRYETARTKGHDPDLGDHRHQRSG